MGLISPYLSFYKKYSLQLSLQHRDLLMNGQISSVFLQHLF
ncbi:hypothetical protein OMAG_000771 [Candidatus Omnitrophus magneticus]|uniref:Uncharacterized protein n=1 Tax=Candidatus Omnitrophus magneticus TaxID=1609969 RepID=A0A0F0CQ23_9BACT|nr:hypothetical protein OMAG_000771 [Candidatus Omnitrophus magneticus]